MHEARPAQTLSCVEWLARGARCLSPHPWLGASVSTPSSDSFRILQEPLFPTIWGQSPRFLQGMELPLGFDEVHSPSLLGAFLELQEKTRCIVDSPCPLLPQANFVLFGIYSCVAFILGPQIANVRRATITRLISFSTPCALCSLALSLTSPYFIDCRTEITRILFGLPHRSSSIRSWNFILQAYVALSEQDVSLVAKGPHWLLFTLTPYDETASWWVSVSSHHNTTMWSAVCRSLSEPLGWSPGHQYFESVQMVSVCSQIWEPLV